jgi:tetratricopeptide (TPR) repeat protein
MLTFLTRPSLQEVGVDLNKPFRAYSGTEPHVFVCYAHKDSDSVYSDLMQVHAKGIHLWYDEGISAGSSWRGEIATAIKGATKFLFYISESSLASSHCLREVDYALSNDIEIIPVYLDDSGLPGELALVLNRVQALFREKDTEFMQHLLEGLQRSKPLASLLPQSKKRSLHIWLPVLALILSLLVVVLWTQRDSNTGADKTTQTSIAAPNAYDAYLEGLELLERWDKDGNLDAAIELFQEAISIDPGFALAFARSAEAFRIRYALSGEEIWLDQAVSSVDEAVRLNADLAPVQVALGRVHATRGNTDLAFVALKRALDIDANDASANQAIAKLYSRLGRSEDADTAYKKAIALDPENTMILNSYASFLSNQGRFDEAISQWQMVIRLAPEHYAALVNLGSVLEETGKTQEAIDMFQRSIEIRPSYMAYSNLGTSYSRTKRYPEAVDAYRQALEFDGSDWLAWGNLATVYSWINGMDQKTTETFEQAIQLAETARQQNPRDVYVHSDLAIYYAKTKQTELALQRLETAIALSPESANILAVAAEVYEVIGQRDNAVVFAQKSIALGFSKQEFQRNPDLADLINDPRMQAIP